MNETAMLRAQYHRLAAQYEELQQALAAAEADRTIAQMNLAEALHALTLIADDASNPVGIARVTKQAIEERIRAQHHNQH